MSAKSRTRHIACRFPTGASVVIAVLVLALLGGLFHHHETASESDACPYCHAVVQTPVADLGRILPTPFFEVIGTVTLAPVGRLVSIRPFLITDPRAPPASTHPALVRESWTGLA